MAELASREKWELAPCELLRVAAYRREEGNEEMRSGRPLEACSEGKSMEISWNLHLYDPFLVVLWRFSHSEERLLGCLDMGRGHLGGLQALQEGPVHGGV